MNINKYIDLTLLKRVLALGLPYKKIFALAGILSLLLAPVVILRPYLIQRTVDEYIMQFDGEGLVFMVIGDALCVYLFDELVGAVGDSGLAGAGV